MRVWRARAKKEKPQDNHLHVRDLDAIEPGVLDYVRRMLERLDEAGATADIYDLTHDADPDDEQSWELANKATALLIDSGVLEALGGCDCGAAGCIGRVRLRYAWFLLPTYNILGQKEEGVICLKCGRANYLPMYDNQHVVIGFKQKPRGSR